MITADMRGQRVAYSPAAVVVNGGQTRAPELSEPTGDLRIKLESQLPDFLPIGRASAVFCFGHCFHRHQGVRRVELVLGGRRQRATAQHMPRRDLYEWLTGPDGGDADPEGRSYRSGFWATVVILAQPGPGPLTLEAVVRLEDGSEARAALGTIEIVSAGTGGAESPDADARVPAPAPGASGTGTIAVCLATYEPDPVLLAVQIQSLRDQTDRDWLCIVSDGGSSEAGFERLRAELGDDPRFQVSRSPQRLDPYRNFERALTLVGPEASLIALCDQDDHWYPDKLAALRAGLGDAQLVYSDQRLVNEDGQVLRDSLWAGRRHDYGNIASLLVANTAPGAAMLFRRELLEHALPFPLVPGFPFHDHWLALAGLAGGRLAYVDRPLYDYVQHGGAVQGVVAAESAGPDRRRSVLGGGSRGWRGAYFGGYVMRQVQAEVLLARAGTGLSRSKRRALRRFVAADRSLGAFLWLALRPLRRLIGRDETLGGELALARGIAWRWLVALTAGARQRPGRYPADASFPDPPQYEQRRLRRWRAGETGGTG
jgi:glycosyltransferase involved in cell wall biosynthesis